LFSPKPKTPIDYKKRLLNSPNQGKIRVKIKENGENPLGRDPPFQADRFLPKPVSKFSSAFLSQNEALRTDINFLITPKLLALTSGTGGQTL